MMKCFCDKCGEEIPLIDKEILPGVIIKMYDKGQVFSKMLSAHSIDISNYCDTSKDYCRECALLMSEELDDVLSERKMSLLNSLGLSSE